MRVRVKDHKGRYPDIQGTRELMDLNRENARLFDLRNTCSGASLSSMSQMSVQIGCLQSQ